MTPGAIVSKKSGVAGGGANEIDSKVTKKDRLTRRRAEFGKASAQILAHLNLANDAPAGKLIKNLEEAKKAQERAKPKEKQAKRVVRGARLSNAAELPTLPTLLKQKETTVNALNYNCDFRRLT